MMMAVSSTVIARRELSGVVTWPALYPIRHSRGTI